MSEVTQENIDNLAKHMNEQLGDIDEVKVVKKEAEQVVDDGLSDLEKGAMAKGWKPKEEFEGNPDDWRPAKQFVEWHEVVTDSRNLKKQIQGMKKNYNKEIQGLNLFHKAQLETKEKEIMNRFNRAVEDGDKTAANAALKEHGEVQQQREAIKTDAGEDDPKIIKAAWEMENVWIYNQNDPKTAFANTAYNMALSKGMDMKEALEFVDERIKEKFPEKKAQVNANRFDSPDSLPSKGIGGKSNKLAMSQVSSEEKSLRSFFKSDDEFLAAVTNSRKGV